MPSTRQLPPRPHPAADVAHGRTRPQWSTAADPALASTTELLQGAAAGDRAAWAELTNRYSAMLRNRIRRYRLAEPDALDAAQDTWLRLAENIDRIRTPEHLGGWLATVASRECLRLIRSRDRTVAAGELDLTVADPHSGPEEIAVAGDLHRAVRAAVAGLPPKRRNLVLALFADEARPWVEIAGELGMPVGSMGPTRARTLAELRRTLTACGALA